MFKYNNAFLDQRYVSILKACGELCDLSKPIIPGPFLGRVKAKVKQLLNLWEQYTV
jgi:hypothetical protein